MKKLSKPITTSLTLAAFAYTAASANAAISYLTITNDADSGISNTNTYTHTYDPNNAATVNGVAFTTSPANFSETAIFSHGGSPNSNPGGNLGTLMQGFIFEVGGGNPPGSFYSMTLSGLTAGTSYDLRIYSGRWGTGSENRTNTLTFDPDGGGAISDAVTFNQNDASTVPGESFGVNDIYYINYNYTAVTGEDLVVDFEVANPDAATWHLYAVTNQVAPVVAVPEPSSAALLGLGGLALLIRRRR